MGNFVWAVVPALLLATPGHAVSKVVDIAFSEADFSGNRLRKTLKFATPFTVEYGDQISGTVDFGGLFDFAAGDQLVSIEFLGRRTRGGPADSITSVALKNSSGLAPGQEIQVSFFIPFVSSVQAQWSRINNPNGFSASGADYFLYLRGSFEVSRYHATVETVSPRSVSVVPEPGSWAMLIAGFGLAGMVARRRLAGRAPVPMAA